MSFHEYLRIICGIAVLPMGILLIRQLVTGRWGFGTDAVRRATAPRVYWAAMGMNFIFVATFVLVPAFAADRTFTPLIIIGTMSAQLFNNLVSRQITWSKGRAIRAGQRSYRGWIIFHIFMIVMGFGMLALELIWPTTP